MKNLTDDLIKELDSHLTKGIENCQKFFKLLNDFKQEDNDYSSFRCEYCGTNLGVNYLEYCDEFVCDKCGEEEARERDIYSRLDKNN
jgi:predicted RNA-binding Zn-ribbon protein involved in translation (DUF1610 family)